ncbi:precorrin-2 C(20)-methyltransferase [Rhodoplanes sp. TEM]|uniref:Precorrin-2 C(20)-methyltransferase n=1 Tax=Rhodoplanes tepidamans TaxID=200616 RepID=A0ABT5J890_RHOTP|nr:MULTISPECIES: precorrin-2 C(20)-methyltransferase [Rhodoplanes]MDC7785865.1 precorrin-2 C(20)-methyltransferase [Rhodoplanes tepidamans]MDC7984977.1 precorrin-2 C(20)-methyltransferase [Rhodoplanes sp. TEM]MDQ0355518.1 precorrin-2/cobalt-factor-2 C20-methyltransferase [Rhodoplanes tepidamans]
MTATVYGVGLGPGDPELISVKADRLIRGTGVVAYFGKAGRTSNARTIAAGLLAADAIEIAMEYPVTTEIAFTDPAYNAALKDFYRDCVARLTAHTDAGRDVVVLCEGDPFLYGSFMHLHTRLAGRVPVVVVPGIPGMAGCWTATGAPITWGDDILTVLPATLDEATLTDRMGRADALVIMKLGKNLPKVRRALTAAGLIDRAVYVERGTMPGEAVLRLADKPDDAAPYFSMVLVHGEGRRP